METCQQVGHGTDILFHAVEHVTGVERLPTRPAAFQDMFKQVLAQFVAQADFRMRIESADKGRKRQLQGDAPYHKQQSRGNAPFRLLCSDVYQVFAEPYERKGDTDAECSGKHAQQDTIVIPF